MESAEVTAETGGDDGGEEGPGSLTSVGHLRNSLDNNTQQIRRWTAARAARRMPGGHDCVSKTDPPPPRSNDTQN